MVVEQETCVRIAVRDLKGVITMVSIYSTFTASL